MRSQRYDTIQQKQILIGMIVHDGILSKIYRHIGQERSPFGQRWLDLVARWCLDYFSKYGKAPRRSILNIFSKYVETSKDEEVVTLLEKFLEDLDRNHTAIAKDLNEDHLVDLASAHFKKIRLLRLSEEIQTLVNEGNLEEAESHCAKYHPIDFSSVVKEDPFSKEAIKETFRKAESAQVLVQFPGQLGRFLSPHFKRSGFVAFAGPEKRGKSFWLLEVVWQALRQKRKVLYYVFGDMPRHEVYQRLYCRTLRRPWNAEEVEVPTRLKVVENTAKRKFKRVSYSALKARQVWDARRKLLQITASHQINLKVQTSGGHSVSASGIENDVKDLSLKEGWTPDIVVIDYADLLEPEYQTRSQDVRHQINLSWMILRRIALEQHCLVVTGTQAAASAYADKWVIRKGDFSEDKRKNAHVTGMLGINQTENEKKEGIYRLNWIVLRGGAWTENQVVWTAGNLSLAWPCKVSTF